MISTEDTIGQLAGPILFLGLLGWAVWWLIRRGRAHSQPVPDEPAGTAYRVYTREYDRVAAARDVPALLQEADRGLPPSRPPNVPTWPARLAAAERVEGEATAVFAEASTMLTPLFDSADQDLAIMLLIDQSGSMHDNILSVAASVRWLSALCDAHGVPLAIAGFTTVGWRGGAVRRQWIAAGRPARPGRLCAFLHIRYRDFDGVLAEEDFRAMLHPSVLRENIDGEAIGWAASELESRPEHRKLLIVLSDGAPVDDSTLMENGPSFLERHIRAVIGAIEAAGRIRLSAIGIEFRVNEYYAYSTDATDLARLPLALAELIVALASPMPAIVGSP